MIFGKGTKENYVIFSPMNGVLMHDGKPMANTTIIRRLRWNGNDDGLIEKFVTDDQGRFSLPMHEEQLSLSVLNPFVGKADLQVETPDGPEYIWTSGKTSPEIFAESGGEMSELVCDLASEEIGVPMRPIAILTRCRWQNMPT